MALKTAKSATRSGLYLPTNYVYDTINADTEELILGEDVLDCQAWLKEAKETAGGPCVGLMLMIPMVHPDHSRVHCPKTGNNGSQRKTFDLAKSTKDGTGAATMQPITLWGENAQLSFQVQQFHQQIRRK